MSAAISASGMRRQRGTGIGLQFEDIARVGAGVVALPPGLEQQHYCTIAGHHHYHQGWSSSTTVLIDVRKQAALYLFGSDVGENLPKTRRLPLKLFIFSPLLNIPTSLHSRDLNHSSPHTNVKWQIKTHSSGSEETQNLS